MNTSFQWPLRAAALSLILTMISAPAVSADSAATRKAAPKTANSATQEAHRIYRDEMAFCASGQSVQGRSVCEKEAKAAHAQNLRGALADGRNSSNDNSTDPNYVKNAEQRCQSLPAAERAGCLMRVSGKAAPGAVLVVPGSEAPLQATTPPRP